MFDETKPPAGELLLYQTEDGRTRVECRVAEETLWLPQAGMAELFQTTKQNIAKHLKSLFSERGLEEDLVVNYWLTTAAAGKRYRVAYYNLSAILAVGYREPPWQRRSLHPTTRLPLTSRSTFVSFSRPRTPRESIASGLADVGLWSDS